MSIIYFMKLQGSTGNVLGFILPTLAQHAVFHVKFHHKHLQIYFGYEEKGTDLSSEEPCTLQP